MTTAGLGIWHYSVPVAGGILSGYGVLVAGGSPARAAGAATGVGLAWLLIVYLLSLGTAKLQPRVPWLFPGVMRPRTYALAYSVAALYVAWNVGVLFAPSAGLATVAALYALTLAAVAFVAKFALARGTGWESTRSG